MKKLLLFFLTILIPTIAAADESGICGDYVTYLYSSDTNTLTISGTGAMTDYENQIDVPWWKYRDKINTVIRKNDSGG